MPNKTNRNPDSGEKNPRRNASFNPSSIATRKRRQEGKDTLTVQRVRLRTKWYNRYKRYRDKNGHDPAMEVSYMKDRDAEIAQLEASYVHSGSLSSAGGSGSDDDDCPAADDLEARDTSVGVEKDPRVGLEKDPRDRDRWGRFKDSSYARGKQREHRRSTRVTPEEILIDPAAITREEYEQLQKTRAAKVKVNQEEYDMIMAMRAKNQGGQFAQPTFIAPVPVNTGYAVFAGVEANTFGNHPFAQHPPPVPVNHGNPGFTGPVQNNALFHGDWVNQDESLRETGPEFENPLQQVDPLSKLPNISDLTDIPFPDAINFDFGNFNPMVGLDVGESGPGYYGYDDAGGDDSDISGDSDTDVTIKQEDIWQQGSDGMQYLPDEMPPFERDYDPASLYGNLQAVHAQHATAIKNEGASLGQMQAYEKDSQGSYMPQNGVVFKEEPITDAEEQNNHQQQQNYPQQQQNIPQQQDQDPTQKGTLTPKEAQLYSLITGFLEEKKNPPQKVPTMQMDEDSEQEQSEEDYPEQGFQQQYQLPHQPAQQEQKENQQMYFPHIYAQQFPGQQHQYHAQQYQQQYQQQQLQQHQSQLSLQQLQYLQQQQQSQNQLPSMPPQNKNTIYTVNSYKTPDGSTPQGQHTLQQQPAYTTGHTLPDANNVQQQQTFVDLGPYAMPRPRP